MQPSVGRYSEAVRQLVNSVLSLPAASPVASMASPNGVHNHHRLLPTSPQQSPPKSTAINEQFVAAAPLRAAGSNNNGSTSSPGRSSAVGMGMEAEQLAYEEGLERRRKQQEAHVLGAGPR